MLIVKPELALSPLQTFDVVVESPGLDRPLTLRAEVVHLEAARAMLRLIDGPVPRPGSLDVDNPFASKPAPPPPAPVAVGPATPMPALVRRFATPLPLPADGGSPGMPHSPLFAGAMPPPTLTTMPGPVGRSSPPSPPPTPPIAQPTTTTTTPTTTTAPPIKPVTPPAVIEPAVITPAPPKPPPEPPAVEPVIKSATTTTPPAGNPLPSSFITPPMGTRIPRAPTPAATMAAAVSRLLSNEGTAANPFGTDAMAAENTGIFDAAVMRGPAVVAAVLPPYFSGDALRFQSMNDLRGARADLVGLGAVLAVCDERPPAVPVDVRIVVGTREGRLKLRCTLSAAQTGTAVVQVVDKSAIAAVFDELDGPDRPASQSWPSSADAAAARAAQPRALALPSRGKLWNPTTPAEVMRLPVHRPVTDADLQRPSVPLLLRWLRTTKGVLRVDLSSDGQPVHSIIVVDGRELRSPVSMQTLGRALGAHVYDYEVVELPRAPALTNTGRTLHLIAEVVRALLAPHEPEAIAAAFPSTKDPRLVRAVTSVVDALGFQGPHARVIKMALQGDELIETVVRGATGARVAWDVLVVLDLFGGLTYVAGVPRTSTPTSAYSTGMPTIERPAILDKDHFSALGLHWSSSPAEVPGAYHRVRAEYQPGGAKRPASAVDADKILKRLEEAFRVLNDTDARRAYRKATYNMVWPHQAQILVSQAKLALYRKDLTEARNLLLAAQDMSGSNEANEMLALLNRNKT
ncbi:MAG: hypothetical protein Q8O67_11860 [Deltaproteobacteria bacterium]|nr:hypothetical protein [Deltaproteobacteria bacterium]